MSKQQLQFDDRIQIKTTFSDKSEDIYTVSLQNNEYVLKNIYGRIFMQKVNCIDDIITELDKMMLIDKWFISYKIIKKEKEEKIKFINPINLEYIKIENFQVAFLDASIKASKFPMSDKTKSLNSDITKVTKLLSNSDIGSGHSCFNKGITIYMDLTATNKFWVQWQRYHHQEIISSESTMHKLSKFVLDDDVFINYTDKVIISRLQVLQTNYNKNPTQANYLKLMYSCPSGLKLKAGVILNLEQIRTMVKQRCNHKLPEWQELCKWFTECEEFKDLIDWKKLLNTVNIH
jgi:hypothetical protein